MTEHVLFCVRHRWQAGPSEDDDDAEDSNGSGDHDGAENPSYFDTPLVTDLDSEMTPQVSEERSRVVRVCLCGSVVFISGDSLHRNSVFKASH